MKKIIIVCDEKREKFGNYLCQLISRNDDTEENTVGIKDGSVSAVLWLEKDYIANRATLASNQPILFIGNSKELKEKREHMSVGFSKYGMKYGSLGNQAFIAVEKVVSRKEYPEFYKYAKKYAENLDKVLTHDKIKKENTGIKMGVGTTGAAVIVGGSAMAVLGPLAVVSVGIKFGLDNKKIKEQMYSCLVMKFYLDYLSVFLGL